MKNANYNLVKMLLAKLNDTWRVEKHYAHDAKEHGCEGCAKVLEEIRSDDDRHIDMLRAELARHIETKQFE
jgi:hypothetical protein